jgi:cephalosporin hydroxylase
MARSKREGDEMNIQFIINRAVNFIRPKPRLMPLTVAEILDSQHGIELIEKFNDFYYSSGVAGDLNWRNVPLSKNPCDLWMMLELMQRIKPRIIVETGTHYGGSATFYADMMAVFRLPCTVITVDYNPKWSFDPKEKGIISLVGYSTDMTIVKKVSKVIKEMSLNVTDHVLVTLDSDHSAVNVREELRHYSPFVTRGSYLIVEDTNVNGHPSAPSHGPGPWEAVEQFINETDGFVIDRDCQRYLLTFNPNGWLRRVV